ncbi:MAG TPA: TraB/GumN family protein, partial [Burkholderiaceae bacterium]
ESGTEARKNQELLAAWEHADEKAFEGLLAEAKNDKTTSGRFFYRDLLLARNPKMANKIAQLLKEHENGFVAIGLLHLLGKEGVPELLKKKGFTVERIY